MSEVKNSPETNNPPPSIAEVVNGSAPSAETYSVEELIRQRITANAMLLVNGKTRREQSDEEKRVTIVDDLKVFLQVGRDNAIWNDKATAMGLFPDDYKRQEALCYRVFIGKEMKNRKPGQRDSSAPKASDMAWTWRAIEDHFGEGLADTPSREVSELIKDKGGIRKFTDAFRSAHKDGVSVEQSEQEVSQAEIDAAEAEVRTYMGALHTAKVLATVDYNDSFGLMSEAGEIVVATVVGDKVELRQLLDLQAGTAQTNALIRPLELQEVPHPLNTLSDMLHLSSTFIKEEASMEPRDPEGDVSQRETPCHMMTRIFYWDGSRFHVSRARSEYSPLLVWTPINPRKLPEKPAYWSTKNRMEFEKLIAPEHLRARFTVREENDQTSFAAASSKPIKFDMLPMGKFGSSKASPMWAWQSEPRPAQLPEFAIQDEELGKLRGMVAAVRGQTATKKVKVEFDCAAGDHGELKFVLGTAAPLTLQPFTRPTAAKKSTKPVEASILVPALRTILRDLKPGSLSFYAHPDKGPLEIAGQSSTAAFRVLFPQSDMEGLRRIEKTA